MTPASEADVIRWQLKCLKELSDQCTTREFDLLISFEEQFNRQGTLSERQMEILEEIYLRRS
ncbi:MAG: hypothetical protein V1755_02310 [Chloroflexota bacterium]